MSIDLQTLRLVPPFSKLSDDALARLRNIAYTCFKEAGEGVLTEGSAERPVFYVLSGHVRIFRTHKSGRSQNMNHLGCGKSFNIPSAFANDRTAPASAEATEDTVLLCFDPGNFVETVIDCPELAKAVLKDLSNKMRHFANLAHDLSLKSTTARIADGLLTQSLGSNPPILNWTHEDIALQAGTVREVVSRTLKKFEKGGLVHLERGKIALLDPDGLEKIRKS